MNRNETFHSNSNGIKNLDINSLDNLETHATSILGKIVCKRKLCIALAKMYEYVTRLFIRNTNVSNRII